MRGEKTKSGAINEEMMSIKEEMMSNKERQESETRRGQR